MVFDSFLFSHLALSQQLRDSLFKVNYSSHESYLKSKQGIYTTNGSFMFFDNKKIRYKLLWFFYWSSGLAQIQTRKSVFSWTYWGLPFGVYAIFVFSCVTRSTHCLPSRRPSPLVLFVLLFFRIDVEITYLFLRVNVRSYLSQGHLHLSLIYCYPW